MSAVPLACRACGHTWASHVRIRPRLWRAGALACPLLLIAAIGSWANHALVLVGGLGLLVGYMTYQLILPACPACGSEHTRRLTGIAAHAPQLLEQPPGEDTRQQLRRKPR